MEVIGRQLDTEPVLRAHRREEVRQFVVDE